MSITSYTPFIKPTKKNAQIKDHPEYDDDRVVLAQLINMAQSNAAQAAELKHLLPILLEIQQLNNVIPADARLCPEQYKFIFELEGAKSPNYVSLSSGAFLSPTDNEFLALWKKISR